MHDLDFAFLFPPCFILKQYQIRLLNFQGLTRFLCHQCFIVCLESDRNFILALHIIIELRYPSLLDWPYLFIVYHLCGGLGSLGLAVLPIIPSVQKDQLIAPSDQSFVVEFYVLCVLIGLSAITAIASFVSRFK